MVNGSSRQSSGPMWSLASRVGLDILHPEPSFSPCVPLYCEQAAAPSAGGPAVAERDVPGCRPRLFENQTSNFCLWSILVSAVLPVVWAWVTPKLQSILNGESFT